MHTRERGAAHINIFYFLVMLVLFLGALGFGYVQLTEGAKLRQDLDAARARMAQLEHDALVYDHYVQDVTKVVGEAGSYAGRPGHNYELAPGVAQKSLDGVTVPTKVSSLLADFAREVTIPESTATPVSSLLTQSKAALDTKDKRIADLEQQNTTLTGQLTAAAAATAEANRQKSEEVTKLNEEKTELRQFITGQLTAKDQTIAGLNEQVRTQNATLDSERQERAVEALALNKEKNILKGQIDALAQQMSLRNPPQQPDGAVISASQRANKAWVDLGRKDMLARGTVFQIVSPVSGALKGRGVVTRVEYDRAELELSDIVDRFDPIMKGDLVRNDLYGKGVRRNIYLMGRFTAPLTKPEVKTILESLGNKVYDKIGPGIDLVILGSDSLNEEATGFTSLTETQEYKDALFLGIEMAPFHKVREFLQLASE
jgi:hypothetical protein